MAFGPILAGSSRRSHPFIVSTVGTAVGSCLATMPDADDAAFERVLESALEAVPVWLLAYCVRRNHVPLSVCITSRSTRDA
jgi:hypothetical protein